MSCEPAGHRWRVLSQLAADRPVPLVCVQPVVTSWVRRTEDLTCDKTDEKDAVLIARLTAQLRCYIPGPVDETWAGCGFARKLLERVVDTTTANRKAWLATFRLPEDEIPLVPAAHLVTRRPGSTVGRHPRAV